MSGVDETGNLVVLEASLSLKEILMEIDTPFPTKLKTVSDAPEPLRSALIENFSSEERVRLLVHAPAFSTEDEKTPATVLAVSNSGWLLASETENGGATVQKSDFGDTLFLELTSILLLGQLRVSFATGATSSSITIKFETVGEDSYREAIDLILRGIDPALSAVVEGDLKETSIFEAWPMKIRSEAQRFSPKGQRLLAAIQWTAILDGLQQLTPAGALLITERELVLISEETESSTDRPLDVPSGAEPKESTGGIITFVPRARLSDFSVTHQEGFDVLALQLRSAQGEEKLEVIFPSNHEKAVSKAMAQMLPHQRSANPTIN
jgi:hypothetical protein